MTATPAVFLAQTHLPASVAAARVLADGDNDLGAGFIAFVVVMVMAGACYFLFRSMSRHLKNVPSSFDAAPPTEPDEL
jgi:hypothetical protein